MAEQPSDLDLPLIPDYPPIPPIPDYPPTFDALTDPKAGRGGGDDSDRPADPAGGPDGGPAPATGAGSPPGPAGGRNAGRRIAGYPWAAPPPGQRPGGASPRQPRSAPDEPDSDG